MATGPDPRILNDALDSAARRYAELVRRALGDTLVSIVLFGSVARGEASAGSDIDLLIVAEGLPASRFARLGLLEDIDREFEPELDRLRELGATEPRLTRLMLTPEQARRVRPLYLDMVEDAKLLHDRDSFFASVLAGLRASLERLGSVRRTRGRIRYWDLKPDLKPGEVFEL